MTMSQTFTRDELITRDLQIATQARHDVLTEVLEELIDFDRKRDLRGFREWLLDELRFSQQVRGINP